MKTPGWFLKRNLAAHALLPFSWIYFLACKAVFFCRLFLTRFRGSFSRRIPIICVGGILAGGVGKTPVVREIASRFGAPVIMRGYKSKNGKGDEATMLERAGLKVFAGNRNKNIRKIHSGSCIVMDDGFQNLMVPKDISILVFDEKIGVGNGFMLPAGPLREPLGAINRADAVIIIKAKAVMQKSAAEFVALKFKKPVFFAKNETIMPVARKSGAPFIAFAGIGYPQKFFENLPKTPAKTISFPDHYQYTDPDLKKIIKKAGKMDMITTEKDWVRLPPWAQKKIGFAPLKTTIEPAFWDWLERRTA
jgi:tetraacyldisaccharide 4'-kinase